MDISLFKRGQLSLILGLSVLAVSCNPEEYYPSEELIQGADAYCKEATDVYSCQQLGDICQPAYEPLSIDIEEPVYATCVANPDMWDPNYGDPTGDGATGGSGDGSGSDDGSGSGDDGVIAEEPSVQDAIDSKCANLDNKYLWTVNTVKNNKVVKTMKKVKVCHMSGNSSAHTIVIACPALNAHKKHDDYLGACDI